MRDLLKSNVSRGCSVRNLASFQVVNLWRVVVLFGVVVSFSIKMEALMLLNIDVSLVVGAALLGRSDSAPKS